MIRQPPPLPQQNRPCPPGGRVGVGVRHVCSVNLSPIHAPICPLPLWGRDGVGFSDAASVFFRPSVFQNHHHRYRACFFTHLQGISAMSPVADDEPTPHPATINPTPALPRGGRESISGKTGDRSRIPSLSGRFYGSGKMANATPSPALSRTTRELFQSRCGLRPAGEGDSGLNRHPSRPPATVCGTARFARAVRRGCRFRRLVRRRGR